jgi:integrase
LKQAGGLRWRTPDGASRSRTFARRGDAQRHLVSVQHHALSGTYVDASAGNVTVADYAQEWLGRQVRRPATEQAHANYLRHVIPYFGDRRLRDVRPSEVQEWVRQRSGVLSPSTLGNVYRFVAALFSTAVTDRLVPVSPCVGVKLPKTPDVEVRPFEPSQVAAIADAIDPRYRALVIAGAALGMRQGELLGLTVDRVDWLRRTVRCDRQMVSVPGREPFLAPVKTPRSVRTLPAPQVALDALAAHLAACGPGDDGLIFTVRTGHAISRSVAGRTWRDAVKRAGFEGAVFHQLRHTAASLLIGRGLSVPAVARYLGHRPAVCLRTYAHMWASDEDRIRAALDDALSVRVTDVSGATEPGR